MKKVVLFILLLTVSGALQAAGIVMARSTQSFPEAMMTLQEKIRAQGYTISRVQRVDVGLTASGYKTDKYRVVFFAKPEQLKQVSQQYPEFVPYLPLSIAIFAENQETVLNTLNMDYLKPAYPDPELQKLMTKWQQDIEQIMQNTAHVEGW